MTSSDYLLAGIAIVVALYAAVRSTSRKSLPGPSNVSLPSKASRSEANRGAPVTMEIEESIDLHFFSPRDIASVVDEYLWEASAKRYREVRLIHGRGKGVQRKRVRTILERHPVVESFRSDGLGSTLARLKTDPPERE